MAFDEDGQADNLERRKVICERAYRILVDEVGFPQRTCIFDPNIFAVATGIEEHANYGVDFIEATRLDQGEPAGRARVRWRLERVVLLPPATTRCARRSTPCSSITRLPRVWTWASSTPARSSSTTRSTSGCASASRTSSSTGRPDATERLLEIASEFAGDGAKVRSGHGGVAFANGRRAHHPRAVKGIDEFAESDTRNCARSSRPAADSPSR